MDAATEIVGEVLRVLQGLGVVPPWVMWLTALAVALVVVLARHFKPWAAIADGLKAWAKATKQDPPNTAPPMDMPPGGMPVPGKEWKDGEF